MADGIKTTREQMLEQTQAVSIAAEMFPDAIHVDGLVYQVDEIAEPRTLEVVNGQIHVGLRIGDNPNNQVIVVERGFCLPDALQLLTEILRRRRDVMGTAVDILRGR